VDLLIENIARVNVGQAYDFIQQKGIASVLQSAIELNGQPIEDLEIIAAEFKTPWVNG